MASSQSQHPANRLIHETSPYLLQHAYNPVDWYPWGEGALQRAREKQKPILLSIGYSACHWCHVMEHESFGDEHIADLMNTHFVCIKVDREERPDLDEIYMQATLAMNQGQGGWPMTVFLTPDQEPIFAGTYFPPTNRWGRPGFSTILQKIAEEWSTNRDTIVQQATRFTSHLKQSVQVVSPMTVGQADIDAAVEQFAEDFDAQNGGFGNAPKFPPATGLSFLLRQYHRTKNEHTLRMVRTTLDAMAAGGIYDQIGGGFARYSTDDRWLVPHFEKMLYDNALLARTYLEAYQVTGDPNYRCVTTETLDYIVREMTSVEGGFCSATDADSEGVEGKFFVWTPEQIQELIPDKEEARRFCAYYDIQPGGNWEHASIPNTPRSLEQVADDLACSPEELRATIDRVRPVLYEARSRRVPPGLDDKVITAWNGMMIGVMAEAARVFGETRYLTVATQTADFLLHTLRRDDGGLYRTYRAGKAHLHAYLEDYAYFAEALIEVYESGGQERYLQEAVRLAERLLTDFTDSDHGGFFTTAKDHETLILRSREGPDGATPSGNAVAAAALARLSFHFGREDFQAAAVKAIRAYGQQIGKYSRAFAKSLIAVDLLLEGPIELALIGVPGHTDYEQLRQEVNAHFVPNRIITHRHPEEPETAHPLLIGKTLVNSKAALYICRNFSCEAPITDYETVKAALTNQEQTPVASSAIPSHTLTTTGLAGSATSEGTAAYRTRMIGSSTPSHSSQHGYAQLGSTGLTTSRIGFGGYRIELGNDEHRQALRKALRAGCNLIDTSTNYADGGSERLIGNVLAELITNKEIRREEVIVVSKIGYVQGHNLKQADAYEKAGKPFPEMVKYGEGLWHCLHPDFLDDQLTRLLDRLGLATLDVCLLHNPEYFLADAKNRNVIQDSSVLEEQRKEFYHRLQAAFTYFEHQVTSGQLQYYGVSSNTCTANPDAPEATSLTRMLEAAHAAAKSVGKPNHRLRVLQLPMNLFESGAWLTPNTGVDHGQPVLALTQHEQIAILVNRPLNAIPTQRGGIIRLADPQAEPAETPFDSQQQHIAALEEEYRQEFAPSIPHSRQGLAPKDYFSWADELTRIRPSVQSLEHWEQIESQMIAPHVNQVMQALARHLAGDKADPWQTWRDRYIPELLTFLKILRYEAAEKSRATAQALTNLIDPLLPEARRKEALSRKALWILVSTPGVACVLNGMRKPDYVEDSLSVLGWEPASNVGQIYEALSNLTKRQSSS